MTKAPLLGLTGNQQGLNKMLCGFLFILSFCFFAVGNSYFHSAFILDDKDMRAKKQHIMQVYVFAIP